MKCKTLFLAAIIALASSCGDSSNQSTSSGQNADNGPRSLERSSIIDSYDATVSRAVEIDDKLYNIDRFARNINRFILEVNLTKGSNEGGRLGCRKESALTFNTERSNVFTNFGTQAKLELVLEDTDKNNVTFVCQVTDIDGKSLATFQKTIRKGYVVSQTQHLNELGTKDIDTLVLMKNAELLFGNSKQRVEVKKLISNDAYVSTFDLNSIRQTPDNKNGESGGELRLSVQELMGDIIFNLRGKNAGAQTKLPARPRKNPNKGKKGKCPNSCDGQQGPRGFPANDGLAGHDGGNSGSVILSVEKETDAEVIVNYFPGQGSEGSRPSLPGLGGEGGEPDSYVTQSISCGGSGTFGLGAQKKCLGQTVKGQSGPQGRLGPKGKKGAKGAQGDVERSVYTNKEEAFNKIILQGWSNLRGIL